MFVSQSALGELKAGKARRALAAQGNGDQGILAALVEELEQSPGLRRDGPNAEEPAPAAEAVRRG